MKIYELFILHFFLYSVDYQFLLLSTIINDLDNIMIRKVRTDF